MKKISIITVNYNNADGLSQTLKSVRSQIELGADIEYIIIDGKSNDGVEEIVSKNNDIISKLICERDTGIYNAMNKGLKIATGDFVLFLNSGDYFYDKFNLVSFANKYFENNKTLFSYTVQICKDIAFLRPSRKLKKYQYFNFGHQGVFAYKDDYKNHFFDEEHIVDADALWQKEIWEKDNYLIVDEISSCFTLGGVSNSYTIKNVKKQLKSYTKIKQRIKTIIKFFLWHLLPMKLFYKLMFYKKCDIIPIAEK